jgi:hypothetical protein
MFAEAALTVGICVICGRILQLAEAADGVQHVEPRGMPKMSKVRGIKNRPDLVSYAICVICGK